MALRSSMFAGWLEIFLWLMLAACASGCLLATSMVRVKPLGLGIAFGLIAAVNLVFVDVSLQRYFISIGLIVGAIIGGTLSSIMRFNLEFRYNSRAIAMAMASTGALAGTGAIVLYFIHSLRFFLFPPRVQGYITTFLFYAAMLIVLIIIGLLICRKLRKRWPLAVAILLFLLDYVNASIAVSIFASFLLGFLLPLQDERPRPAAVLLGLSVLIVAYDLMIQQILMPSRPYAAATNYAAQGVFSIPVFWYLGARARVLANSWAGESAISAR
jgi:hypothetical protein